MIKLYRKDIVYSDEGYHGILQACDSFGIKHGWWCLPAYKMYQDHILSLGLLIT
jgi:hypothetical protein